MENGNKLAFPSMEAMEKTDPRNMISGGGLTKREYFAVKAMQSFILNKQVSTWQVSMNEEGVNDDIVSASVALADALLKQLEPS